MKTIRIIELYRYFLGTLIDAVNACYVIKAEYVCGKVSYKRAHRQLSAGLKFAWQRYNLCFRLSRMFDYDGADNFKLQTANVELKELTEWTIA